MKHYVTREIGLALDSAIEEFTIEGVLAAATSSDTWKESYEPLLHIALFELAKYLIEGYEYPKSKEESIDVFVDWLKDFNNHTPYPTKNSSYRRGRRNTLEAIEKKLIELNLLNEQSE